MNTTKEKAKEFCAVNGLTKGMEKALVRLLKEQDRDTRHACAEAVIALSKMYYLGHTYIDIDSAAAACINVNAV